MWVTSLLKTFLPGARFVFCFDQVDVQNFQASTSILALNSVPNAVPKGQILLGFFGGRYFGDSGSSKQKVSVKSNECR